ncbi:hypothetical protein HDU67_006506 [Dinochytrium kinnereticum]|nr:hypothetical protein HDU67_006506 [Dinochytrium kinnereticum]
MNTILNKYQNLQCIENCSDPDPERQRRYEQPVWQTIQMFIGEALCLMVFYYGVMTKQRTQEAAEPAPNGPPSDNIADVPQAAVVAVDESSPLMRGDQEAPKKIPLDGWKSFLLWIPTLCDMTATTLMSVGLLYISASIYQMLRGSVVLFTGALSTIFLGRRHPPYRLFALAAVFVGVLLVGVSSIVEGGGSATVPIPSSPLGVILVVLAQTITASQFVLEEVIMSKYDVPPLRAVGLEGIFGLLSAVLFLPIIYMLYGKNGPKGNFFDLPTGLGETLSNSSVLYAGIGICFSIAFFNWSGLSVTNRVSATARSTIDTCRTVFIWAISLYLGWETFKYIQVLGFLVLVYGTFIFNDILPPPFFTKSPPSAPYQRVDDEEN